MHTHMHTIPHILERQQHPSLMQTLGLDYLLHEIRLRHHRRDGQAHRHGHAAQCHRVAREAIVASAHVARVEVGIRPHGREVERVDAGVGQHAGADAGRLAPDTVQVVPGRVAGRARGEEGAKELPHVVHAGVDVGGEEGGKGVGPRHVEDRFGAGDEEAAADVARDRAEELAAEGGDFVVVVGAEAAEEHGSEGKVGDDLVDDAGEEEVAGFDVGHEVHGGVGVRSEGEAGSQGFGDEVVVMLIGDVEVIACPVFGGAEERPELGTYVRAG